MSLKYRVTLALGLGSVALCTTIPARADRTFLVGGTVLEGKATRKGNKVIVQVESGEVAVPADSVQRIETSESVVGKFEALYAALPPGDAKARLALADYCRDHGMRSDEHRLLVAVLDIDRDNADARARLGYVKTETGWVTRADAMRAKGMVEHEGQWISRADLAQLEREQSERQAAAARREAEDRELQAKRFQLAAQEAELDAQAERLQHQSYMNSYYSGYGYYSAYPGYPYYYPRYFAPYNVSWGPRVHHPIAPAPILPPQNFHNDTSLSVVKVPYRRH
jgi:hypothetical protein